VLFECVSGGILGLIGSLGRAREWVVAAGNAGQMGDFSREWGGYTIIRRHTIIRTEFEEKKSINFFSKLNRG
jgi:hypothetical protein